MSDINALRTITKLLRQMVPVGGQVDLLDPKLPGRTVAGLVKSDQEEVRWLAASLPHITKESLRVLLRDHNADIVAAALENPRSKGLREMVVARFTASDRLALARANTTPSAVLLKVSQDKSSGVQKGLAGNVHTPQSILLELCQEPRYWEPLARNPGLGRAALKKLIGEIEQGVRPGTSGERGGLSWVKFHRILRFLARNPRCDGQALGTIFQLGDDRVKEVVLACPAAFEEDLREGFGTGKLKLQRAVVRNPEITQGLLVELDKIDGLGRVIRDDIRVKLGKQLSL